MGVGGIDSWGAAPLSAYEIEQRPYHFRFILMPLHDPYQVIDLSKLRYDIKN